MQNNRHRFGAALGLFILSAFTIPILISEIPLLPEAQRNIYIAGRMTITVVSFFLSYLLWLDYKSYWVNLAVGVDFAIYTLFSQWHRPLYVLAFLELSFALSFIYTLPKATFRALVSLWMVLMLGLLWIRWDNFTQQMQHVVYSDFAFMCIVVAAITLIAHTYFTADRAFREATLSRFSRMGYQSSRLIHDLKGLTSAPRTYSELLTQKLGGTLDPVVSEALNSLSTDLANLNRVVLELNHLSMTKGQGEYEAVPFERSVCAVSTLLGARMRKVSVENRVVCEISTDPSLLNSILLNLFMNSIENFSNRKIENAAIVLTQSGNTITVSDNGHGFKPEVLKAIQSQASYSSKVNGGLGLWMVKDGMDILNGKATFKNNTKGAEAVLTFPRGAVSKMTLSQVAEPSPA